MLRILKLGDPACDQWLCKLKDRGGDTEAQVEGLVREVLEKVRINGDSAVLEFTRKWDGFLPSSFDDLIISKEQMAETFARLPEDLKVALKTASYRIQWFHERMKEDSWFSYDKHGSIVGQKVTPIKRIGAYVPGGRASYPSSLLMNVIPARVAGVEEIVVCAPATAGEVNPAVLAAGYLAGVDNIYRIGGAQAIAAMAFGTESIPRVDKIVGPGNVYVAMAKSFVYGVVDIDMVAGPSEILVLADETASSEYVASDLLSQAEHDPLAAAVLITTSLNLAELVAEKMGRMIDTFSTAETIREALANYGGVVVCQTLEEGVELVNRLAPEHLEILTKDPWKVLPFIDHAGAIFLGPYSSEPMGDYVVGPNHVLPTGRRARFSSPLGTRDFVKYSSVISLTEGTFKELSSEAMILAHWEGLPAHARAVEVRGKKKE
jgi:histidinol dehydrogenase